MKRRILLVSQNPVLAAELERSTREADVGMSWCRTAPFGPRLFVSRRCNLAIVDGGLPGMTAFDVCRGLRKGSPDLHILMYSAEGGVLERVLALELGADDAVTGPLPADELLARAKYLLRRGQRPKHPAHLRSKRALR